MKIHTIPTLAMPRQGRRDYRQLTLLQLTERIVLYSDKKALEELHNNRKLFRYKNNKQLVMADYLVCLKERDISRRWCGRNEVALENAYDLTLDKFSNLPIKKAHTQRSLKIHGPDCRYYYKAFCDYAPEEIGPKTLSEDVIETEITAARILQKMVTRHFYLSCLESRRREQKLIRRYRWKINGQILCVWLPTEMPACRCRQWLQANIPNVDPGRIGERERVQAIANRLLMMRRMISLYEVAGGADNIPAGADSLSSIIEEEIMVNGLTKTVANEKADHIDRQRPAIKELGKGRLKQMIHKIFANIVTGEYQAKDIAAEFGLSESTFSRFAGSEWKCLCGDILTRKPPDLWKNTGHVLAHHSVLIAAAKNAGM